MPQVFNIFLPLHSSVVKIDHIILIKFTLYALLYLLIIVTEILIYCLFQLILSWFITELGSIRRIQNTLL